MQLTRVISNYNKCHLNLLQLKSPYNAWVVDFQQLGVHCRTEFAALLWPSAASVVLHQMSVLGWLSIA